MKSRLIELVRPGSRRLFCAVVGLALAVPPAVAQFAGPQQQSVFGRVDVSTPDPTADGDWNGTWFFVSKNRKMALWFKGEAERPEMKFRLDVTSPFNESLTTDWNGHALYSYNGTPGTFDMTIKEMDANHIAGSWVWWLGDETNGRRQTANFNLYRTAEGRTAVMLVTDAVTERFGRRRDTNSVGKQVWSFRKATARQARWGELPF